MDDLISRQAAATIPVMPYDLRAVYMANMHSLEEAYKRGWEDCQSCILLLPAVEKKGKWISETGQYYQVLRCDQCGHVTVEQVRNYCPNCGTKMEENE